MTAGGLTPIAAPGPCVVRTRVWRNGTLEAQDFPLEDVSDYLEQPDCLVWADLCMPTHERLNQLAEELSLDPHAVEDAGSEHERPKATRYPTHLFLTAYAVTRDEGQGLDLTHVSAFCLPHAFVTVRLDNRFDIERVVERWDENVDLIKFGPRALEHGLLDVIVDDYFVALEGISGDLEDLEDALFDDSGSASKLIQRRLFETHKTLIQGRRAITPMREVVGAVSRRIMVNDRDNQLTPYFDDLYDHVLRAVDWLESLRDMVNTILDTNTSLSDVRMNLIMKKLTAWAAIIAVPTAVTGYFGQNVPYPGFGREWGVLFSLGIIVVVAAFLYVLFKRKDWL
jgi:magnesium transporter